MVASKFDNFDSPQKSDNNKKISEIIKKKCWPKLFEAVLSGKKKFDLRLADFSVSEGDTLVLEEYDPEKKKYTGRKLEKKVSFVIKTKETNFWPDEEIDKYGFVVLSLE